jgi:hypothetical protein
VRGSEEESVNNHFTENMSSEASNMGTDLLTIASVKNAREGEK